MKTIHDDLLAAQVASSIQPAIQAVFTSRDGTKTYDYSFNPLVTTNRLEQIEYREEPFDEYAKFILRNDDLTVPDLVGYYVDLGIGANCSGTLRYGTYPRRWVKVQHTLSGGIKGQRPGLKSILELTGVWNILKEQYAIIGLEPLYQDQYGMLTGKTIYGMLEYLIETMLVSETGITFTLDPLGDQDDGVINNLVLEPTHDPDDPFLNPKAPDSYETLVDVIERILWFTGCYLRAKPNLAFKVIYPQASDAINENYYSSLSAGHVFYENTELGFVKAPNWVKLFCKQGDDWTNYVWGEALSNDWTPPYNFIGQYMPVLKIHPLDANFITSNQMANKVAAHILAKYQAETFGGRTLVPHDARVELYDRVAVFDTRGK